jgi:hypothetical protein
MAESEGFEPPIDLRLCLISSQVHSTGLCQLSVLAAAKFIANFYFYRTPRFCSQIAGGHWLPDRVTGGRLRQLAAPERDSYSALPFYQSTCKGVPQAMPDVVINTSLFRGNWQPATRPPAG